MKTSPPPANRSSPYWKWAYRGILLIVIVLIVCICGFALEGPMRAKFRQARARADSENFARALDQYAVEYGYHPEGAPADLLRTLQGDNQRKIIFFECATRSVSSIGEFIDPWGQPYHIDQSDPSSPRVYSSGPNGLDELGAKGSDDIVARPKARQ
jgi:hypothetical protein